MKKIIFVFLSMFTSLFTSAQLLTENFNYTTNDSLTANGWLVASGGTTNALRATDSALTLTGYPASGIGKSVPLTTSGQDVVEDLSVGASNNAVYASFLTKINSAQATGDYFFGFLPQGSTTAFTGRTFVRLSSTGYFRVGVSKGSLGANETLTYSNDSFVIGQTYLFVLKYTIIPGTTNDSIKLFVLSSVPTNEPSTPTTFTLGGTNADVATISRIFIRQGSAASADTLNLSGIRVNNLWSNTALPVELIHFEAQVFECQACPDSPSKTKNMISWSTAWELNNQGFEIQRSTDAVNFETLDFVKGAGNSNTIQSYIYFDRNPRTTNYYRLKQIDFNGDYEYSKIISATSISETEILVYPNPFEDNLTFSKNVINTKLYNSKGELIQEGLNLDVEFIPTGIYYLHLFDKDSIVIKKVFKK